jgi:hypothetical protein
MTNLSEDSQRTVLIHSNPQDIEKQRIIQNLEIPAMLN